MLITGINSLLNKYFSKREMSKQTTLNKQFRLFDPGEVEAVGDEGVGVRHLLDDFAGGFAGPVAWLCVHEDEEGVCLLGVAAYNVLEGGDVLQGVERHYPVVVVPRQQQHRGVLHPVALWDADVVQRGVSGRWREEGKIWVKLLLKLE